ncbi:MAG TPA: histidine kinase, partial [Thermoanaerobaculia bacterium]
MNKSAIELPSHFHLVANGVRGEGPFALTLPRLQILATVIPILAVLALESVRLVEDVPFAVQLLVDALAIASIVIFSSVIFRFIADLQRRLKNRHEELLATQAALAIADERLRIAQEMHDGVSQLLGYVNVKAQAVESFVRNGETDEACRQLHDLGASARQAYDDVREGIAGLRTRPRAEEGVAAVLREFLDRWHDRSGISTQLAVGGNLALRPSVELQLVRIIQEALTNTRKHAKATSVRIDVRQRDGSVFVRVEDDGLGFDPQAKPAPGAAPRL